MSCTHNFDDIYYVPSCNEADVIPITGGEVLTATHSHSLCIEILNLILYKGQTDNDLWINNNTQCTYCDVCWNLEPCEHTTCMYSTCVVIGVKVPCNNNETQNGAIHEVTLAPTTKCWPFFQWRKCCRLCFQWRHCKDGGSFK